MAICPTYLIDGNTTGLFVTEETCPGQLPGAPVWYAQEPNSYNDMGGDVTTIAREFIDPSRQNQKGTSVDEEAAGGWNTDVTRSNLTRLLQGFFFADARQPFSTMPLVGTQIAMNSVFLQASTIVHSSNTSNGLTGFNANDLVARSGYNAPNNNGIAVVVSSGSIDSGNSSVAFALATPYTTETPPVTARLDNVGIQFTAADIAFSYVNGVAALSSTTYVFNTNANLFVGQWIFLGGDLPESRFTNNVGYARIRLINAKSLVFDETTWLPVTEAGTGKTIRLFYPVTVKNENNPALIKKRTYQIERTLGLSPTENLVQAEYLEGSLANEFTVSIPTGDKVTADLSYVALRSTEVTGTGTDLRKTGTRVPSKRERLINTSTDVYRMRMTLLDPTTSYPTPLFGYITDGSFSITNNVATHKAIGVLGSLATTVGTFNVTGSCTAYFTTPQAKRAMRSLANVGLHFILAKDNWGLIFDIPLVSINGGKISVEKDTPVTIPLEARGAENSMGYTASYSEFRYLPTIAMPQPVVI